MRWSTPSGQRQLQVQDTNSVQAPRIAMCPYCALRTRRNKAISLPSSPRLAGCQANSAPSSTRSFPAIRSALPSLLLMQPRRRSDLRAVLALISSPHAVAAVAPATVEPAMVVGETLAVAAAR